MTRVAKLFRLACKFYELGNGDYLSVFSRPLIESAIVADYLMRKVDEAVEDFRRCSYKNTLRIFRDSDSGSEFVDAAAGQGVLRSAHADLALEGLSRRSFGLQKRNRWRLECKAFRRIFEDVMGEDLYAVSYGASSESVHGSWQDIRGYSLQGDAAGQGFYPLYEPLRVNIGNASMIVTFATLPFREWAKGAQLDDPCIGEALDFIDKVNIDLFDKYGKLLHGF